MDSTNVADKVIEKTNENYESESEKVLQTEHEAYNTNNHKYVNKTNLPNNQAIEIFDHEAAKEDNGDKQSDRPISSSEPIKADLIEFVSTKEIIFKKVGSIFKTKLDIDHHLFRQPIREQPSDQFNGTSPSNLSEMESPTPDVDTDDKVPWEVAMVSAKNFLHTELTYEACKYLAVDCTEKLGVLVEHANSFVKQCKRRKLTGDDFKRSLISHDFNKLKEDEKKKVEHEKKNAEYEKRKAEYEKRKAEHEKRKAEREKKKIEHEKRKAERKKRKAEHEKRKIEYEKKKLEHEKRKIEYKKRKAEHEKRKTEYEKSKAEKEKWETECSKNKTEHGKQKIDMTSNEPDIAEKRELLQIKIIKLYREKILKNYIQLERHKR